MTPLLTFTLGLVVGACVGLLVAGLCHIAARADLDTELNTQATEAHIDE